MGWEDLTGVVIGLTNDGDREAEEDDRTPANTPFLTFICSLTGFRMSAALRLYATRSSANPAVTLYNALTEDLAAEASGSTPIPRHSKRIKAEDDMSQ